MNKIVILFLASGIGLLASTLASALDAPTVSLAIFLLATTCLAIGTLADGRTTYS